MQKKSNLPQKICSACGLPFAWRKKWERSWPDVKFCSERCKRFSKNKKLVKKNLVITDTIDNGEKTKNVKNIEVLPISGLMGEAIKRISNSTSVSDLFK